jgi:hypothetical protein
MLILVSPLSLFTEYCRDFELETDRIERGLDPTRSLIGDKAALGIM